MGDKHVELFERALVEKEGDTLTGGKLALLMLFVDTLLTSADFSLAAFVEKFLYFFFKCHFYDCLIV